MANIASAKKRAKQTIKRQARNTNLRSRVYTYLKKARKAIASGVKSEAETAVKSAFSQIDKMVPKGIFHKNKAGRLKSRLNASLKKLVLSS
ncbi:MAG TPA: 30S ribosomal protein S20 [Gammaproteobacteria bacterium]|nr:30S ribosomal protein S20 [Gammaproteobacteria bacterium]